MNRWRTPGFCSPDHRQQYSLHNSSIFANPVVAPPEPPAPEPELPAALRRRPLGPSRRPEIQADPLFEAAKAAPPIPPRPVTPAPEPPMPASSPVAAARRAAPVSAPASPVQPPVPALPAEPGPTVTRRGVAPKPPAVTPGLHPPAAKRPAPSPEPPPPSKPEIIDVSAGDFFKSGGRAEPARPLLVPRPLSPRNPPAGEAPPLDPARRTGSK
jgi:hypothetical protein